MTSIFRNSDVQGVVLMVDILAPALPQESLATCVSALPPAVRRWLCPAETSQITLGYAPGFGLHPSDVLGQGPHEGHSPKVERRPLRQGIATASHQAAKPKRSCTSTYVSW